MKFHFFMFVLVTTFCSGQSATQEDKFIGTLTRSDAAPDGLLSSRSAVLFSDTYTQEELLSIQKAFQQTGIDAVEYYRTQMVLSGKDVQNSYGPAFVKRGIKFVIFVRKENNEFQFWILPFTQRIWSAPAQIAWMLHGPRLQEILITIFRNLSSTQKKQNFLINDFPEQEPVPNLFANFRNESMVPNLKNFKLAVPGLGDKLLDEELANYLKDTYHGKYEMVPDTLREKDMIQKGFRYVLRYIHAPGQLARTLLGYDVSKAESALVSATYSGGTLQLKTIPAQTTVYKFYLKDLDDKNLYYGLKWDADISPLDATKNYFDGYHATGRLN